MIGREFELDVLRQVLAWPEEELEIALEEALGGRIDRRTLRRRNPRLLIA